MWYLFICLSVCQHDYLKNFRWFALKFTANVRFGPSQRWLDFGADLDQHLHEDIIYIFYHCQIGQAFVKYSATL